MGYAIYQRNGRDCGYGVPAWCDFPCCNAKIDRGLGYLCGEEPGGDEFGCGLYFCGEHLFCSGKGHGWLCLRCLTYEDPYEMKPDHPEWNEWKMTDESWAQWRAENGVR
jgi:hypothetical protein